jgi:hypothetical protein
MEVARLPHAQPRMARKNIDVDDCFARFHETGRLCFIRSTWSLGMLLDFFIRLSSSLLIAKTFNLDYSMGDFVLLSPIVEMNVSHAQSEAYEPLLIIHESHQGKQTQKRRNDSRQLDSLFK